MRNFKKISFEQFKKDIKDDACLYNQFLLPNRSTECSAGYDFYLINDLVITPGEIVKIPTGYKCEFNNDEVLFLIIRSSLGFKYNIRLCNQVGVIDSDYYNNQENEGHIFIALENHGSKVVTLKSGDRYCQGIFTRFLKTDDDEVSNKRTGGIGSTNKEEKI